MSKKVTDITFDEAKKVVVDVIDLILEFTISAATAVPNVGFEYASKELKILQQQIRDCSGPFLDESVADAYIQTPYGLVLNWQPIISEQLNQFNQAHIAIADFNVKNPGLIEYELLDICESRRKQIIRINEISNYIFSQIKSDPNNKSHIFAFFFNHILKTQETEYSFIDLIEKTLDKIKLHDTSMNFNVQAIFSVVSPILTKNNKYITDGRAIRDLLAHNQFELTFDNVTWKIHLKSPENWNFTFDREFTAQGFIEFESLTDLLYKSTFIIVCLVMLNNILKNRFVRPPLI